MKTKKCSKCGKVKSISEFSKEKRTNNGYRSQCKICRAKLHLKYCRNNPNKIKEWRKKNPEYDKTYRKDNRENRAKYNRQWRKDNPKKAKLIRNRAKIKFYSITKNRLSMRISRAIYLLLKGNKNGRHWESIVGYTLKNLIIHLESLFKDGMTWELFMQGKIHIDHKIPISFFEFNSYKDWEFKYCWSLDNLQPLWASENLSKGTTVN